jgi:glucose-6-phosphate isomerase
MTAAMAADPAQKSCSALAKHQEMIRNPYLRVLLAEHPSRAGRMTIELFGPTCDESVNQITGETIKLLKVLAEQTELRTRIDALFHGDRINRAENRTVHHVARRAPRKTSIVIDGQDVMPGVHVVLDKMANFSNRIRGRAWKGHSGKRIRNVINLGIGGSGHGPLMAYEALKHCGDRTRSSTLQFVKSTHSPLTE